MANGTTHLAVTRSHTDNVDMAGDTTACLNPMIGFLVIHGNRIVIAGERIELFSQQIGNPYQHNEGNKSDSLGPAQSCWGLVKKWDKPGRKLQKERLIIACH